MIQNFEISIAYRRSSYISEQKIGCSRENILYRNSFLTLMLLLETCNEDKEIYYCCIVSILLYCFVLQNWSVNAITVSNLTSFISAANTGFMCSSLTRFYLRKSCWVLKNKFGSNYSSYSTFYYIFLDFLIPIIFVGH